MVAEQIEAERRATEQYKAGLDKEVQAARALAEAEGRIKEGRANEDINRRLAPPRGPSKQTHVGVCVCCTQCKTTGGHLLFADKSCIRFEGGVVLQLLIRAVHKLQSM